MNISAYLYSASSEYTRELADRMAKTFQANACICISDPQKFGILLSRHPLLAGRSPYADYVSYVTGSNEFSKFQEVEPFKKLEKFAWQKEFRICWDGDPPKEGAIIDVPEIIPLLSVVE